MAGRNYPLRFVMLIALTSLLLLVLCATVAVSLYRIQTGTAEALAENIASRRAASDLEEDLAILLKQWPEKLTALHKSIGDHLAVISKYADKPKETEIAGQLADAFHRYSALRLSGR